MRNAPWSLRLLDDWMFIEENAARFEILKADDVHKDQPLLVALLQGFDARAEITPTTYKELRRRNDLAQKRYLVHKLDVDYEKAARRPIWDAEVAKFAVAIEEAIINAKTPHFRKGKADQLEVDVQFIWLMHFYWKFKYRTKTVFSAFQYALQHC